MVRENDALGVIGFVLVIENVELWDSENVFDKVFSGDLENVFVPVLGGLIVLENVNEYENVPVLVFGGVLDIDVVKVSE